MISITQDVIDHVSEGFSIPSIPDILLEVQRISADPEATVLIVNPKAQFDCQ